ncbi:beta-ribofuranosylaminobenzene 5'-phosphate synthase family protein [Methylomicrobium sp. Wu6]|uniref:beta-ribofuranosylaminobenzene 5'-phosphate synthase family protein n=1 Tax=Methylomicrobium sp. Wu6 TaxID=3107928 RepID=UPI002DD6793C|nr:beta-ribofuranosylaminobenzene 5'-phosphate synthase family protein [Methylomicrobium sp. Wu6]MEC4748972.1 beta-ribofuranosylaminobenzene 5'-phosphate synthase family protein [Methylomicrobium sp. Wu6]
MQFRHQKVSVTAPARLHMGFIDLSGSLGRHFGSIGVALNEQATCLTVAGADRRSISGPSVVRAEKCLTMLCEAFNIPDNLRINIESAIPEHVGLGSGTQMSLAIGAALNAFYDLGLTIRDIAKVMVRGQRSGIGIGVFEQGGLVVDGGRGEHTITPPLLARMAIPEAWRFILVFDKRGQGLHGLQEIQAFQELPPFPRREAEQLSYLLLMQALPALAENDIVRFGEVITRLQRAVGEHFAAVQGGIYTSPEVATAMQWLAEQGAVAVGQTSWGPTGFCMVNGIERAAVLVEQARHKFAAGDTLTFISASARNSGGLVVVE